jgi:hypothetical protein
VTPEEFQSLYPHVIGWIHQTLAAHAKEAKAVASLGFRRLSRYFSEELLTSTKVVVINRVPMPALSSMGLSQFAEFERGDYEGITYLDTFFVKRRGAAVEWLHFHELIHVITVAFTRPGSFPRGQRWSRKSGQDDKWSFCLTAGTLCPANQERQ